MLCQRVYEALLNAPVPLTILIVGVRADGLRKAKTMGLGRTLVLMWPGFACLIALPAHNHEL